MTTAAPAVQIGTTAIVGQTEYTYRLTGAQTQNQIAVIEVRIPPRAFTIIPHVHEAEDETVYVIEGTCKGRIGDQVLEAGPGEAFFMPRGIPHALANPGETPARLLFILNPAGLEPFFADVAAAWPEAPAFPLEAFDDFNGFMQQAAQANPEVARQMQEIVMPLMAKYDMHPPAPENGA